MSVLAPLVRPRQGRGNGLQLFASTQTEARVRRPTDAALAVASVVVVLVAGVMSELAADFERSLADLLELLPGLFDAVWSIAFWAPVGWALLLLAVCFIRRRLTLARDLVLAVAVALLIAAIAASILHEDARSLLDLLADVDGPPVFPPGAVVMAAALIATASPHVTLPCRHLGRWLIGLQLIATLFLGVAVLSGALAAVGLGLLAAALVHLAFGSPGGRPTASRIRLALQSLGVDVDELSPASMQAAGVVLFEGVDREGPVLVKVYGRDAWDAQLLANLWRLAWYRGAGRTARLSRVELVEHEAFVTLLAERAGVHVPRVVTAGRAGQGDALVVVRPTGEALDDPLIEPREPDIASLWTELHKLHEAGIAHRRIDLDRVRRRPGGGMGFGDMSTASVVGDDPDQWTDRAQVLVLSLLLVGEERAIAAARAALGDADLATVVPYVQEAAMAPMVRKALDESGIELDEIRERITATLGAAEQPLIKLRRVTWGSLLNLALLTVAAYTLISLLGGLDLETFLDALAEANWWWLAFALLLAQIPRIPAAVSTLGATTAALPLGPLVTLQFAICYVNLAIPSTAARVAINIRFFQRFGVPPTSAVSAGLIDSVSGFVIQILLFVVLFFWSDLELDLTTDTDELSGVATIALIVIVGLLLLVAVVALVPALRRRVLGWLREAKEALRVLRSPVKLLQLFGGNLLSQVLFAVALGACVRAFGYDVPLTSLVLINTAVSLFAGLLPVPGGIGVSEAGLTLGLTRAGLPSEIAFAAALASRFVSFYLPPIWGWFCYRWLVRQRFL